MQVYSFTSKSAEFFRLMNTEKEKTISKAGDFIESKKHFISLCQDACECVCLFQAIPQYMKFTKCLAIFKGESNRNLSEDFTISIEDAICIALSKQDDYCRSRQYITSEETVMQLLFYHYQSSRYIIWRSSYRYYPRGRYKYSCIVEFIH